MEFRNVSSNRISGNLPLLPDPSTQTTFMGFKLVLKKIDFSNNSFTGEIPESWSGLSFLEEMNLAYNSLQGSLPKEIGRLSLLKTLNLSNNQFSGPIPDDFRRLTKLQTLDLRNNRLTGSVPEALGNLSNLQSLFLDNNSFSCIPTALAKKAQLNITYSGKVPPCHSDHGGLSLSRTGIIGVAVGSFVCAFGAVLAIALLLIGTKKKRSGNQLSKDAMPKSAKAFSLREIKTMTENFKQPIGKGGFGVVYYGKLPSGKEIAVKVKAADSKQGAKEFLNEVQLLCRLHHRNIVPILGYCLDEEQQILVYEYMPQGTLFDHLHQPSTDSTSSRKGASSSENILDWKRRLNILLSAARGLEYLHKDCKPPVIHRDVKSSNILLTEKLEGKVSDLGISKQAYEPDTDETLNMTGISTAVQGTWGYLDPEYFTSHKLTAKSDVYSFGVILLEVVTGKRAQCQKFPDSEAISLKGWVEEALEENALESMIDPRLKDEYSEEAMVMVVKVALSCLLPEGAKRPDMGDIIRNLLEVLEKEEKLISKSPEVSDEITVTSTGQFSDPATTVTLEGTSLSLASSDSTTNPGWKMSPR
ncbi:hypothetical protein R1sor_004594 [Riccia sorocarpa]|uniref:Protein kinase domain-containing protein n=1 Tax=Riccia sorocarpa TaxID=122646 RepID=A0ABD3HHR3_9MARC